MSDIRPIETAPRDGTEIEVMDPIQGSPMGEAPRDGTVILAETCNHYGVPETGGYDFKLVQRGLVWGVVSWIPAGQDQGDGPGVHMSYGEGAFLRWWPAETDPATLTLTPRTNWKYVPSNGTEGDIFHSRWCSRCERERRYEETGDVDQCCPILTATAFGDISDPDYPEEWTLRFGEPRCTAFKPRVGEPAPLPRMQGGV